MRNILARIWAFWGLLSFVATFLIFVWPSLACYLIPEPRGQKIFIDLSRVWMNIWLRLVGCPLKVKGTEQFQKGVAYIVTYNHNSFMDVPLSCPFIPGANKTIAKKSFTRIPLFGWFYRKGAVLVDRKSDASRRKSYEDMKAVLAKGMHMSIYPEGTRNRTDQPLKAFYDGAFKLACETGHAIIPGVIFHTRKVLPTHKAFYFWPRKLEMHFLTPVSPAGKTVEELKSEVFDIMKTHYTTYSPE